MSLLQVALTGLRAHQTALSTTGHNISNASTEGYSRQRVDFEAYKPEYLGGSYVGVGVQVSSIQRMQSDLIDAELRASLTDNSYAEVMASEAEHLDTLFADESTGLEPVLERFLNSAQDVASDPTSMSSRTVMLEETVSLAERFNSIGRQIDEQRSFINGKIETSVAEINDYATALANLNGQIVSGGTVGEMPNDLLDQRDNLLRKLAEKVDVNVTSQDNGAVNVFIGTGQALVVNSTPNELVVDNLSGDPINPDIGVKSTSTGNISRITPLITGGEIGGLVEARDELLDRSQNELGLIALNIAESYNAQNRLGLDMDGELGGDIFTMPKVGVTFNPSNDAVGNPAVTIESASAMTASDYRLSYDGTDYQLKKVPDGDAVPMTLDASGFLTADGLQIDTSAISGANRGDSWLIQPTRNAASQISVSMRDPADLAAAGAVNAEPSELNTGSAVITGVRALDTTDPAVLFAEALITYDETTGYSVEARDAGGVLTPVSPAPTIDTVDGVTTISANGWELTISGTPADQDRFIVSRNDTFEGDNRNMLAMSDIENQKLIEGKVTIQRGYTDIIAGVGTQTERAQILHDSSTALLESAQAKRESLAGVNLDEEAADLIRYQQAYQASAQVITVARTLFDTILNAVG